MSAPKGTALITGASTGIGAVYADRLAKRGYDLILVARSQEKLSEVAARLKSTGRRIETISADLTKNEDVGRVADRLSADPAITALVNNAGAASVAKLLDSKIDDLETMISLNVTALTRLALAALPGFVARKNGLLINIASVVALAPDSLNGTYSGTKAYVVNFTQALKSEVEGKGVTVQAVLPGATATLLWEKAGRPVEHLPREIVMTAEDMVDAALAGLDQHELITIPSLPDIADWEKYEAARKALGPNLSRRKPAARYGIQS
ncbi:MAG TPA: SDR family oxidoreductase [Edaphobacter sp.]|jgi:short-subunit dehydrogenase|nr:SDR family oxidoreductase [Edaphobacter sp.]